MIHGLQLLHLYKPPPPYPISRPSSNSTPDLASKTLSPPQPAFINPQVSKMVYCQQQSIALHYKEPYVQKFLCFQFPLLALFPFFFYISVHEVSPFFIAFSQSAVFHFLPCLCFLLDVFSFTVPKSHVSVDAVGGECIK